MDYKRIVGKRGERFYQDGRLVKASGVPSAVKDRLRSEGSAEEVVVQKPVFDATSGIDVEVKDLDGGLQEHKPQLHTETLAEEEITPQNEIKEPKNQIPKACIVCGGPDEFQRQFFVEKKLYRVSYCDDHYYKMNLGKTVGMLRDKEML